MTFNAAKDENLPQRRSLPHEVPTWVRAGELFFITICCTPRGANQLCRPDIAAALFESVKHRQDRRDWFARLVLLMPDHLHALISFPADREMTKTIRLWKTFMARQHGIEWQRDFFDHRIRAAEQWELKATYIRGNPVRAGLVADAKDWLYAWERE
jgi:putative transposase